MTPPPVVAITDTGALGRAIAELLVERGLRIALYHDPIAAPEAEALVAELGDGRAETRAVEPGAWGTLAAAVEATRPAHAVVGFDRWDGGGGGPLHLGGWRDGGLFERTATGNLEAVYRALRVLLPPMVAARAGSVVVLGSRLAERPWEAGGAALYAAAKAGALALVRTAAEEVRAHGVRVNAILTGVLDAPAARLELPGCEPAGWPSPAAIARTVAFLVSDDAAEVTGAVIPMYRDPGDDRP